MKKAFPLILIITLFFLTSKAWAKPELSFFLGKKDGSENSDGVTVRMSIEEDSGFATEVFNVHWAKLAWSHKFVVDLSQWAGKSVSLNITTDPGPKRNINYDWILIGDAKITDNGKLIYDIGQAVITGSVKLSMLLDGETSETVGLGFGANCTSHAGTSGGLLKPKSFMQHPPWDKRVGNAIARHTVVLPELVSTERLRKQTLKTAVIEFEEKGNLSIQDAGEIVAELMSASLQKVGNFDLYERVLLQKVLHEQKLGASGLLNRKTTAGIGKLFGVEAIVTGTISKFGSTFSLVAKLIDTETAKVLASADVKTTQIDSIPFKTDDLAQLLALEQ